MTEERKSPAAETTSQMMAFIKLYAYGSCAIGLLEIFGAITVLNNSGLPQRLNGVIWWFEVAWIPVSVSAMSLFVKSKLPVLSPQSYVVFKVFFSFVFVLFVAWLVAVDENQLLKPIVQPAWAALANWGFGLYFLGVNALLAYKLTTDQADQPTA